MNELITSPIDPKEELTLVDYMNEIDMVVKPALRVLYGLEDDAFQMNNQDLKSLLFSTLGHWDRIDEIFLNHNRKVKGLPMIERRNIWGAMMPPEAENQTIEA